MRHLLLAAPLLLGLSIAHAEDDDGYGKWEVVTEMKTTGAGGDSTFKNTDNSCRGPESVDESNSEWSSGECKWTAKSGGSKSRMHMRCDHKGGDYEETIAELTASKDSFKRVTTSTTVRGKEKTVMVNTETGRRLGPCPEES